MTLGGVLTGDLVVVDVNGRRGLCEVTERRAGGLDLRPITPGFTWRTCTAHQVKGHWRASSATRAAGVRP